METVSRQFAMSNTNKTQRLSIDSFGGIQFANPFEDFYLSNAPSPDHQENHLYGTYDQFNTSSTSSSRATSHNLNSEQFELLLFGYIRSHRISINIDLLRFHKVKILNNIDSFIGPMNMESLPTTITHSTSNSEDTASPSHDDHALDLNINDIVSSILGPQRQPNQNPVSSSFTSSNNPYSAYSYYAQSQTTSQSNVTTPFSHSSMTTPNAASSPYQTSNTRYSPFSSDSTFNFNLNLTQCHTQSVNVNLSASHGAQFQQQASNQFIPHNHQQTVNVNLNCRTPTVSFRASPCKPYKRKPHKSKNGNILNSKAIRNLQSLSIQSILKMELTIRQLIDYQLITRLMRDKLGSQYLQNQIKSYNDRKCSQMITVLINHFNANKVDLLTMANDIYGNYLIQVLFCRGDQQQNEQLLDNFVYDSVLSLTKSQYGCRVIQKILDKINDEKILTKLMEAFKEQTKENDALNECLVCMNSNHVIQAMIKLKLEYDTMKFIGDALESNLVRYSEDIFACRVIQIFIKTYGDKLDIYKLLTKNAFLNLSTNRYGNYVIQCVIKKDEWYSSLSSFKRFRDKFILSIFKSVENVSYLSYDKHGSNVMEECIRVANQRQIDALIKTLCAGNGHIVRSMMNHKFGNYVPKTLISHCFTAYQQEMLINALHGGHNTQNKHYKHQHRENFHHHKDGKRYTFQRSTKGGRSSGGHHKASHNNVY